MKKVSVILDNLLMLGDNVVFMTMLFLSFFIVGYFFFMMTNNREVLEKKTHTQTLFFSILVFYIVSFVGFLIISGDIYLNTTNTPILTYFINEGMNGWIMNSILIMCLFILMVLVYKIIKTKSKKYQAKQTKDFEFTIKERFKKTIDNNDMNDMRTMYEIKEQKKEYLNNYEITKFTYFKDNKFTECQIELFKYLRKITKETKIKEKIYEFEILRLIEITIDKKIDLKIGQFRVLATTQKDDEIIGAIYNMRENNITNDGFAYYTQYMKRKDIKDGNN